MSGRRRFFSGTSESQAAIEAAAALDLPVAELLYRAVDKRGGLRPGRIVIEVDPENARRPAGAAVEAAVAAPAPGSAPAAASPRVPAPPPAPREARPQSFRDDSRDGELRDRGPRGPIEEVVLEVVGPEAAAPFVGEAGAVEAALALAALADLQLEPRAEVRDEEVHVDLAGPAAGALTARQGELLRSFEYLLRRVVRDLPEGGLAADSGGFRAEREASLQRRAAAAAEEVRRGGAPVVFEPLAASERRLVHLVIQEEAGVASASDGDGELKRVRVFAAP